MKSFCGGSRGALIGRPCQGLFSKRVPLAAGGNIEKKDSLHSFAGGVDYISSCIFFVFFPQKAGGMDAGKYAVSCCCAGDQ